MTIAQMQAPVSRSCDLSRYTDKAAGSLHLHPDPCYHAAGKEGDDIDDTAEDQRPAEQNHFRRKAEADIQLHKVHTHLFKVSREGTGGKSVSPFLFAPCRAACPSAASGSPLEDQGTVQSVICQKNPDRAVCTVHPESSTEDR